MPTRLEYCTKTHRLVEVPYEAEEQTQSSWFSSASAEEQARSIVIQASPVAFVWHSAAWV